MNNVLTPLLVVLPLLFAEPATADVLARLKPSVQATQLQTLESSLASQGAAIAFRYTLVSGLVRISVPISTPFATAKASLLATGSFQYVEQDYTRNKESVRGQARPVIATTSAPPAIPSPVAPPTTWIDDPQQALQYGVDQNGSSQVWKTKGAIGDPSMVIAILDSGIDYTHPDLVANLWRNPTNPAEIGYDFVNNGAKPWPWDDDGHGTHVAGIAAAVGGNGIGISGQCPRCAIMALKVLDANGVVNDSAAIEALDYGLKNGASVFLIAWGGPDDSQALKDAIQSVSKAGKVIVVASGNDGADLDFSPEFPAKYQFPGMVTVGGLYNSPPSMPFWTNYSATYVHLSSGGADVYSTWPGGGLVLQSGTSMAAAQVAGGAALIWSYRKTLKATDVVTQLKTVTKDPDSATKTVFGGRPDLVTIFSKL